MTNTRRNIQSAQKLAATNGRSFRTFLLMQQFAAQEIGQRIAQARREAGGMTQEELADALNVSKRSLQSYEAGVHIPWKHFETMGRIFGRPLEWFLRGENEAERDELGDADGSPDDRLAALEAQVAAMRADVRKLLDQHGRAGGSAPASPGSTRRRRAS